MAANPLIDELRGAGVRLQQAITSAQARVVSVKSPRARAKLKREIHAAALLFQRSAQAIGGVQRVCDFAGKLGIAPDDILNLTGRVDLARGAINLGAVALSDRAKAAADKLNRIGAT